MVEKALNLSRARKGQIFLTQNGKKAVYLGKDSKLKRPYMFRVGEELWSRQKDGRHCSTCCGTVYPAIVARAQP